jgi:hypothetical protein
MFERRLGRKPVLPLILNGGSWIAKPLRLARLSAVSSKLVFFSRWEKVRMRASPAPRILFPF